MDYGPPGSSVLGDSPGKNTGVGCHPPRELPDQGIEPSPLLSPALAGRFFTPSTTWGTLNGILFRLKKEEIPAICDNADELGGHYSK